MLHIWAMSATNLNKCYISVRWMLHIWTTVTYLDDGGYTSGRLLQIWTLEVTYPDDYYISGRWRLHIWTAITYLDDECYISGRWMLHIWTMEVTYLDDCYTSGHWRLHIWTTATYLDDGGYIAGRMYTYLQLRCWPATVGMASVSLSFAITIKSCYHLLKYWRTWLMFVDPYYNIWLILYTSISSEELW